VKGKPTGRGGGKREVVFVKFRGGYKKQEFERGRFSWRGLHERFLFSEQYGKLGQRQDLWAIRGLGKREGGIARHDSAGANIPCH